MEWGDKIEFLKDIEKTTGQPPKALAGRPNLPSHLAFVWEAFWSLSTDRPLGFTVGRIPFSAIATYADRYGVRGVDKFDRFKALIMAMDRAFIGRVQKPSPPSR